MTSSAFLVGVDIAQSSDFTAITVAERIREPQAKPVVHVRHARRQRGVTYPALVDYLAEMTAWPALADATLYVDATGVGRPVVDMLRERLRNLVVAVTITGGDEVAVHGRDVSVPKRDLVAALQVLLQTGRLKVAADLAEAEALRTELANFAVKISDRGHDSYAAAGTGHDDLVMALALTAWGSEQHLRNGAEAWTDFYRQQTTTALVEPQRPRMWFEPPRVRAD